MQWNVDSTFSQASATTSRGMKSIAMIEEKPLHTSSYLIAAIVTLIGVAAFASVFVKF